MNTDMMQRLDALEKKIQNVRNTRVLTSVMEELCQLREQGSTADSIESVRACYLIGTTFFREGMAVTVVEDWPFTSTQSLEKAKTWFDLSAEVIEHLRTSHKLDRASLRELNILEQKLRKSSNDCLHKMKQRAEWHPLPKNTRSSKTQLSQ